MADTGFVIAGTGATGTPAGGTGAWVNPDRITADDSSYATNVENTPETSVTTEVLRASNFDFSALPEDITISGVEVRINRKGATTGNGVLPIDSVVRLINSSSAFEGFDNAALGDWDSETSIDYGGAADLWGATLTRTIVTDPNFGVGVQADLEVGATSGSSTASVDAVWIKIYYTLNAPDDPSDCAIDSITRTKATISWVDNASTEDGFTIERSVDAAAYASLTTVAANVETYEDTHGLLNGQTVAYRVKATLSGAGDSGYATSGTSTVPAEFIPGMVIL